MLKYLFCGPALRSRILEKVKFKEALINRLNLAKDDYLKKKNIRLAEKTERLIQIQKVVVADLKDLLDFDNPVTRA